MTHYAMIDNYSGYFWGGAHADTPEDACKYLDMTVGEDNLQYEDVSALASNETGYHVYEVLDDFDFSDCDGQAKEIIDYIKMFPKVAVIKITKGSEK